MSVASGPGRRVLALALGLGLVFQAAAPVPVFAQPAVATPASGPPPIAQCARQANLVWRRLQADLVRTVDDASADEARLTPYLARATLPEGTDLRPSDEALIIVRAFIPPYRHYQIEDRSVAWREPDGQWWFWRQRIDWAAPPPPPPPPPADPLAAAQWTSPPPPSIDERFPPSSGKLGAIAAAAMESAWSDPCRAWEPAQPRSPLPLRRPEPGSERRERACPQGAVPIIGEITEAGRPAQLHVYPCDMDFSARLLLTHAAYATRPSAAEDRVMVRLGEVTE